MEMDPLPLSPPFASWDPEGGRENPTKYGIGRCFDSQRIPIFTECEAGGGGGGGGSQTKGGC